MKKMTVVFIALVLTAMTGCANYAQHRATEGAIIGAVAGKAWGDGSDRDVVTGALIGTGLGYIVGNEEDKYYQQSDRRRGEPRRGYSRDPYYERGNAGVKGAYHRGRSEYYRDRQREAERRARDLGRAGW